MALSVLAVVVLDRLGDVLHDWSGERCRIMLYMTLPVVNVVTTPSHSSLQLLVETNFYQP
jgi:hypothetical protein